MSASKLLVLRPGNAGAELAESLNGLNLAARHAPTLAVDDIPFTLPSLTYEVVIFISPTAVTSSPLIHHQLRQKKPIIIAVGSGTAAALEEVQITEVRTPDSFNSEGLIAMPELQQVAGKQILIIKGVGGRTLLYDSLIRRGAKVDKLNVYDRRPVDINDAVWTWYLQGMVKRGLTSASIESLLSFDTQRKARSVPKPDFVLVASDRIAEVAVSLGYTDVRMVGGAANHYFVTAMEKTIGTND